MHSLRLGDIHSIQQHIKEMTEFLEGLLVVGDPVSENDCVVCLLASLPESYDMWVQ